MYYATKNIYNPIIAWGFYDQDSDSLSIWVITDSLQDVKGTLKLRWQDWRGKAVSYGGKNKASSAGKSLRSLSLPFHVGALNGTEMYHYDKFSSLFPSKGAMHSTLLNMELSTNQGDRHTTWFHPNSLAKTSIPDPRITLKAHNGGYGSEVSFTVTAKTAVAAYVWLDHPSTVRGYFDDNGFWLNKGGSKTVKFTVWDDTSSRGRWVEQVKVRSLWDNTQKSPRPFV